MQTVQFQCGHCGSMMGVGLDYLGQQVRCPTCQQVVVAPASAEPSAPEPSSSSENAEEMFLANLQSAPLGDTPKADRHSTAPAHEGLTSEPRSSESSLPWQDSHGGASTVDSPVERAQRMAASGGLSWLWLLPLLSYSILVSFVAVLLYLKLQSVTATPPNRDLELMPDLIGDAPLKKEKLTFDYKKERTTRPLPEAWKAKLGDTITIGSLEITPLSVEKKVVNVMQGAGKSPCKHESLVLHLELRNVSDKFAFVPLDNYFDRRFSEPDVPPFTCLELGSDQRFYGGPARWFALPSDRREWVEGRKNIDNFGLAPGKTVKTLVCTDGNDNKLAEVLKDYEGNLLWRVHVRCGPVQLPNKLVAATAVVGVTFSDRDYRAEN